MKANCVTNYSWVIHKHRVCVRICIGILGMSSEHIEIYYSMTMKKNGFQREHVFHLRKNVHDCQRENTAL